MKPSWDDAPEWAKWLAMDKNGAWGWYSKKPSANKFVWENYCKYERAYPSIDWTKTLQKRPKQ